MVLLGWKNRKQSSAAAAGDRHGRQNNGNDKWELAGNETLVERGASSAGVVTSYQAEITGRTAVIIRTSNVTIASQCPNAPIRPIYIAIAARYGCTRCQSRLFAPRMGLLARAPKATHRARLILRTRPITSRGVSPPPVATRSTKSVSEASSVLRQSNAHQRCERGHQDQRGPSEAPWYFGTLVGNRYASCTCTQSQPSRQRRPRFKLQHSLRIEPGAFDGHLERGWRLMVERVPNRAHTRSNPKTLRRDSILGTVRLHRARFRTARRKHRAKNRVRLR